MSARRGDSRFAIFGAPAAAALAASATSRVAALAAALSFGAGAGAASASILPPGFTETTIASGFQGLTSVAFAPDGRLFVAEKQGLVWIVRDGVKVAEPFLDLRDEVHNAADKGLLGLALDPAFSTNGWVYLLYSVDPDVGAPDEPASRVTLGRLARYTAVGNLAAPASRFLVLGESAATAFPHCSKIHSAGTIRFANDGTLFVGCGDGAYADRNDFGQNLAPDDADCEGLFGAAQDIGAMRSQVLHSMAGKILRIDPRTGEGLPTNPFWTGNATHVQSKVWALGLRNPFRFTVLPSTGGPGGLLISEVGWLTWEEINVARFGGENFGWPCLEGEFPQERYSVDPRSTPYCNSMPGALTAPALSWNHEEPGALGFTGFASTGSVYSTSTTYPVDYRDGIFFADFGAGWIRFARLDAGGNFSGIRSFAFGVEQPVDVVCDPTSGDLVYVSLGPGKVKRITYSAGNVAPVAELEAIPAAGPAPLAVRFSPTGTKDANGDPLTFRWDFGDGSVPVEDANPLHVYNTVGSYFASLIVTDPAGLADTAFVTIETLNMPPEVTLESPVDGQRFHPGQSIALSASVFDREDGSAVDVHWEVQLIHNSHVHSEWFVWDGLSPPPFVAEDHATDPRDRFSYRVLVTATDQGGLATLGEAFLLPEVLPENGAPVPDARAPVLTGTAPLPVYFDGTNSWDPDDDLLFLDWDFGDGFAAQGLTPGHVFGGMGAYRVVLSARDVLRAEGSAELPVLVFPGSGILGHWNFDENGGRTAIDASGHFLDASVDGAFYADGILGMSLDFNGVNGEARLPSGLLGDRAAFTISAWIAPDAFLGAMGIVGQRGAVALGFVAAESLGVVTAFGGNIVAHYPYRAGEWRHIAARGDGTQLQLFVDGAEVARGGFATFAYGSSGEAMRIGGGAIFDAAPAPFAGRIDEVRVYGRALPDAEVQFLGGNPAPNHAPYPEPGGAQDIVTGTEVTFEAVVSDDARPAGAAVSHVWRMAGSAFAPVIEDSTAASLTLQFDAPGTYTLTLEASDGELVGRKDVPIRVRGYRQPVILEGVPALAGLESIGPNPTRGPLGMTFGVTHAGSSFRAALVDVNGRYVSRWSGNGLAPGRYRMDWDGRDEAGLRAGAGVYFVILDVQGRRTVEKAVVVR